MLTLHKLFEQCVFKFPERNAIVWDNNSCVTIYTYSELKSEINSVVDKLRAENIQCEYVGVQLSSLLTYPAVVLGILHSQCAYVMLDLKNDIGWNINLLKKLNIRIIITDCHGELIENWRSLGTVHIHNNETSVMCCDRHLSYGFNKDNFTMAYAIQTSGTTGSPKVVQVPHSCIVPNILHLRNIFDMGPCDTVFLSSPITFDPSVVETFIALTSGACLLITPEFIRAAPGPHLFHFLFNRPRKCGSVSILSLTPSYAACLFFRVPSRVSLANGMDPNLKVLCLGGEPCPSVATLKKWADILGKRTRIFSLYGVTEVSCWAAFEEVSLHKDHYPKQQIIYKHKGDSNSATHEEFEPLTKHLKLDDQRVNLQACSPTSESTLKETICETELLPSDNLDPKFEDNCAPTKSDSLTHKDEMVTSAIDLLPEVSLGLPLAQTVLDVRDSFGHPVCNGEGELHIGSKTRICLLDDETPDILKKGDLIFRATGDIVFVRNLRDHASQPSPVMYYKGRRDGAVKRFGQWIFVETVETAASEFIWKNGIEVISVDSACCVWNGKETGRGKLGLFVIPSDKGICQDAESQPHRKKFIENLASHLTRVLPSNSWPDIILLIGEFPLSSHGKVDRVKLLGRLKNLLNENTVPNRRDTPMTHDELLLNFKSLWMQYLNVNYEPSPSDKFLLSGGDSLLALRLVAELEDSFNCSMPPMLLVKLINGTYEEACSSIHITDLSGIEHDIESSTTATMSKIDQVADLNPSTENVELPSSVLSTSICEGDNSGVNDSIHLCLEYTRGKILRHNSSSEFSTYGSIKKSPQVSEKWKYDLVKCVDASPVLLQYNDSKSIVVVGSHSGIFAAVNFETGEQIFRCTLPDRIESSACSSPCGKYLFVGCYDHCLYCISVPEGKIIWSFAAEEMVKSSPLIANHGTSVVFGSYSGHIYCLDIKQGDLVWKVKPDAGSIYSSPALYQDSNAPDGLFGEDEIKENSIEGSDSPIISTGIILCGTLSGICAALTEKEGIVLWERDLKAPVFSSPLVYDHFVVFSSVKGRVTCFSVKSGDEVWNFQAGGNVFSSFTSAEAENNHLIVFGCHDHYVYCLSGDGVLLWKTLVDSPVFATPFLFTVKFGSDLKDVKLSTRKDKELGSNMLAVCSTAGHLYVFNCCSGTIVVDVEVQGQVFSSPVVKHNLITFGCRDNFLYCFTIT